MRNRREEERITTTCEIDPNKEIRTFRVKSKLFEQNANRADLEKHFIKRLERCFDRELGDASEFPDERHDRSVEVEMGFTAGDILLLRELHESEIDAAFKGTEFSREEFVDFLFKLRTSHPGTGQGEAISEFMNKHGVEGLGMLKAVLRDQERELMVGTVNGKLASLREKVDATLALYEGTKITDDMTKKELTVRFQQLEKAETRLERMIAMVENDPLMGKDEIKARKEEYESLHLLLRKAFNPDDLDRGGRSDLIKVLEKGWTTGTQYRIIEEIKYRNVPS